MGSEMCIRDRVGVVDALEPDQHLAQAPALLALESERLVDLLGGCLLYTSDAADERSSVDLGGRRIITKKKMDYQLR